MKQLVFNNTLLSQKLFSNEIPVVSKQEYKDPPRVEINPYRNKSDKDQIILIYHNDEKPAIDSPREPDRELSYFDGMVADALFSLLYSETPKVSKSISKRFTLTELLHTLSCSNRMQLTSRKREMLTDSLNRLYRYEIYIFMHPDSKGKYYKALRGRLLDFQLESDKEKTYYRMKEDPVLNRYTKFLAEQKSRKTNANAGEQKITATDYQLGIYHDQPMIPGLRSITVTSMMLARYLWMRLEIEKHRTKMSETCTILVYSNTGEGIIGKLFGKRKWDELTNDIQKLQRLINSVNATTKAILEYYLKNGYITNYESVDDKRFIVQYENEDKPGLWADVLGEGSSPARQSLCDDIALLEAKINLLDQHLNDPEMDNNLDPATVARLIEKCGRLIETLNKTKTTQPTPETSENENAAEE